MKVEMHFLPDVYVPCDVCQGQRYNRETLDVRSRAGNRSLDVLTVEGRAVLSGRALYSPQAADLSGRASTSASARGPPRCRAARRSAKLALELSSATPDATLYILDEPTTGPAFRRHRTAARCCMSCAMATFIVVIEHNLDVIKTRRLHRGHGPRRRRRRGGTVVARARPSNWPQPGQPPGRYGGAGRPERAARSSARRLDCALTQTRTQPWR